MGKKVSLIFSGGGIKAVSYLGFVKALEEADIEIDTIGGISGGALVAVVYALGKDYDFIKASFLDELSIWKMFEKKILFKRSVFSEEAIDVRIKKLVGNHEFKDLKPKVVVFASNLTDKKLEIFDSGKLENPLKASIALTPIVPIARFNGKEYIDGGFLTVYPTTQLRKYTKSPIIGLLARNFDDASGIPIANRFNYVNLLLVNYYKVLYESDKPDAHFVTLEKQIANMFSFKHVDQFYEAGYESGKKNIGEILKILDKKGG